MAKNIIALMFPEYNDIGNPVTSKDWVVDELYDDKTFGVQIKETGMFVDFFNDEECNMIYDSMNLNAYLYGFNGSGDGFCRSCSSLFSAGNKR